jgi:hypothetical protein
MKRSHSKVFVMNTVEKGLKGHAVVIVDQT